MITKIRLQNWKSFKDSTIYIDSLGILIGTNASGKSNVLDAFAFRSEEHTSELSHPTTSRMPSSA